MQNDIIHPSLEHSNIFVQCLNVCLVDFSVACIAGGMRERASGGGAANFPRGSKPASEFASGEAASEFPACHISYGFYLPPTFITCQSNLIIFAPNGANACDSSEINFVYMEISGNSMDFTPKKPAKRGPKPQGRKC